MRKPTEKSLLTIAIKKRFGTYNYNKYFGENDPYCFFSKEQEKELLEHFATKGAEFIDHPIFDPFRKEVTFRRFFSRFYFSSLDLLLKLHLLKEILEMAHDVGLSVFEQWSELFAEMYHRDFADRRNLEWETLKHIHKYLDKQ